MEYIDEGNDQGKVKFPSPSIMKSVIPSFEY